jgi:cytochrome c
MDVNGKFAGCLVILGALAGCARPDGPVMDSGGDPQRGEIALTQYACPACHVIPGIVGANGLVGPSLDGVAVRAYLGGVLPNTPDNLVLWLENPPAVVPSTAMPDLGVTEQDARDMAAYLYTLE